MADDHMVLEILRTIQADVTSIKTEVALIKTDVAALQRQGASHSRTLDVLRQDVRMIRAAVNDIARTDVTSGEVRAH